MRGIPFILATALVMGLVVFIFLHFAASGPARPNIILISIDTLRADHLGCYGYARLTSPTIDRLAKRGVKFLQTFSQAPKTAPSHMTIMTSLYPDVHGVVNWNKHSAETDLRPRKRLDDAVPTLAEVLKKAGYVTVAFTGGANVDASLGFDKGFDLYTHRLERGKIDDAISWLEKNPGERFFLFYHDYIVHDPYLPPPPYTRRFDPEYDGKILDTVLDLLSEDEPSSENREAASEAETFWKNVDRRSPRDIAFLKALYDGAINYMDEEMIRPLIEVLEEKGLEENTLIIFTSDHGEAFSEHGNFVHDDVFRETVHVPLILLYPGVLPENVSVDQPVRSLDIMPTVLDLLDIEVDFPMQGESLVPALGGRDLNLWCFSTHPPTPNASLESLRTDAYSYLFRKWTDGRKSRIMDEFLFDRKESPNEELNVIQSNARVVEQFKRILSEIEGASSKITFSGKAREVMPDAETREKLKALGYAK